MKSGQPAELTLLKGANSCGAHGVFDCTVFSTDECRVKSYRVCAWTTVTTPAWRISLISISKVLRHQCSQGQGSKGSGSKGHRFTKDGEIDPYIRLWRRPAQMTFPINSATSAVRAALESDTQHGAVVPPLHLSSNYTFENFGKRSGSTITLAVATRREMRWRMHCVSWRVVLEQR